MPYLVKPHFTVGHRITLLLCFVLVFQALASSQFTLEGDANDEGGGCYQLTADDNNEIGAAWFNVPISLDAPFDLVYTIYLGNSNNGGDGMAWVIRNEMSNDLQPNSMPGQDGQYLGYGDIDLSLEVEIDTDDNNQANDPNWDHLAVMRDGEPDHDEPTCLFDPVPCLPDFSNVEDNQDHTFRVTWNPIDDSLKVYFDCFLRIATTVDLPDIIDATEGVWGFVASTETEENEHRFCEAELVDPEEVELEDLSVCAGESVLVTLPEGLVNVNWSPSTGVTSAAGNSFELTPEVTTEFTVTWEDECGNEVAGVFDVAVYELELPLALEDLTLCDGASIPFPSVVLPEGYSIEWGSIGGALPTSLDAAGSYVYFVGTPEGCFYEESLEVGNIELPDLDLGADVVLCPGETVVLDSGEPATVWSDNSIGSTYISESSELVTATYGTGLCTASDAIQVTLTPAYVLDWESEWTLCGEGDAIDIVALSNEWLGPVPSFDWGVNGTESSITVSLPGDYGVQVTAGGCSSFWETTVNPAEIGAVDLGADVVACSGDVVELNSGYPDAWTQWAWNNMPQGTGATFSPEANGTIEVTVTQGSCVVSDAVEFEVVPTYDPTFLLDELLCQGETATLDATDVNWEGGTVTFEWDGGPNDALWEVSEPGTYGVDVLAGGCLNGFAVDVVVSDVSSLDLGSDLDLCAGEEAGWVAAYPAEWCTWSLDGEVQAVEVNEWSTGVPGTILCEVFDGYCGTSDEVIATLIPSFDAQLPSNVTFCAGETVTVNAALGADEYLWSTDETSSSATVDSPGTVSLVTTYLGCESTASVNSIEIPLPEVDLGEDVGVCEGELVVLSLALPDADWIQWNGVQYGPQFNVNASGVVEVVASVDGCSNEDEVYVEFYPSPSFDLGPDQNHCFGQAVTLEAQGIPLGTAVAWLPSGIQANSLVVSSAANYVAHASLGGCMFTDSIFVDFASPYDPGLPEHMELCLGTSQLITAAEADPMFQTWYAWSPGGEGRSAILDHEGSYSFSAGNACGIWEHVVEVEVEDCECSIYVPSAFTPNNDGRNDRFMPEMSCTPTEYTFELLDRWGVRFFFTEDPNEGWIGEVPDGASDDRPFFGPQDVYVFRVTAVFVRNGIARHKVEQGQVLLLR